MFNCMHGLWYAFRTQMTTVMSLHKSVLIVMQPAGAKKVQIVEVKLVYFILQP